MFISRRSFRKLFLFLGLSGFLSLALLGAMKYTSRSEFCLSCHEMKPVYTTWQSSNHQSVSCVQCHSDPGLGGLIQTKVQALAEVYRHITKTYRQPITIDSDTAAFTNRCLRCHDIKGKNDVHNLAHFTANVNCAACHLGLVHNPDTNRKLPGSEVCKKCHGQGEKIE